MNGHAVFLWSAGFFAGFAAAAGMSRAFGPAGRRVVPRAVIMAAVATVAAMLSGCGTAEPTPHSWLSWVALAVAAGAVLFVEFSGRNAAVRQKKNSGLDGPEVMPWPTEAEVTELEGRLSGGAMVIGTPIGRNADGSFSPVSCGREDDGLRGPMGHVRNVRMMDGRIFADIVPTQDFVDELRGVCLAQEGEWPPPRRTATVIYLDAYRQPKPDGAA